MSKKMIMLMVLIQKLVNIFHSDLQIKSLLTPTKVGCNNNLICKSILTPTLVGCNNNLIHHLHILQPLIILFYL
jgi:hypothetical protein